MARKQKQSNAIFEVDSVISDLITRLSVADGHVKAAIARQLGELGHPSAVAALAKLLESHHIIVRIEALKALSKIDSDASQQAIVSAFGDHNERVKTLAIEACGKNRIAKSAPKLIDFLSPAHLPRIRCAAADVLGELKDERAVKPLITLLKSDGHATRISAVEALGKIGGSEVKKTLKPYLQDSNSIVRREAAGILRRLG